MLTPRKLCRLLSLLAGMALCPAASYAQAPALPCSITRATADRRSIRLTIRDMEASPRR